MYDSGLMRVSDLDSEAGAEVLYVEEGELKAILLGRELKAGTTEREYVSLTCTVVYNHKYRVLYCPNYKKQ